MERVKRFKQHKDEKIKMNAPEGYRSEKKGESKSHPIQRTTSKSVNLGAHVVFLREKHTSWLYSAKWSA